MRDIIKKKQKLLEFAGYPDSPKGMCSRKTMKTSTYEDLDKAMVVCGLTNRELLEFSYQVLFV